MNFCVAILIVKMEKKKKSNILGIYALLFWSFVLEIPHWMMLHNRVDQLKLIAIKSRH